jgi:ribosomal protein S18 acetylase RimI-like enzyme
MKNDANTNQVTFSASPTEEEVKLIQKRLEDYGREQTHGELDNPGIEINLVLKDNEGNVVGGLGVSTMIRVMHLDVFWVAEEYRKLGYGRDLVLEAERIGREKGCILSHTWSFSFQSPGFYQKIGYEVVGIYDGYPDGITEYVLRKSLQRHDQTLLASKQMSGARDSRRFSITENATAEEMKIVHAGLHNYVVEHIRDGKYKPGRAINLVVKDQEKVVGGLLAWTPIMNLAIENIWLDEGYRGRGHGTKLVLDAERIAKEHGCIACQICSLSFQAPEFFQKLGYETFGIDDGYPDPIKEYYFIKKFESLNPTNPHQAF